MRFTAPASLAALILTLAVAADAAAQSGPLPRSSDEVVLARVYRRTAEGTDPVGRIGIVLAGKPVSQSLELAAAAGQPATTFELSASRKGEGARVTWSLRVSGGQPATGEVVLPAGALSRVSLESWTGGELFASLEAGRASSFEGYRLSQHFGAAAYGMTPQAQEGVAPVLVQSAGGGLAVMPASAIPVATSDRPKGPALEVQCPGGGAFTLSLDSGKGECRSRFGNDGEGPLGATCSDADGNVAELDCRAASGRGACVRSSGNGSCKSR